MTAGSAAALDVRHAFRLQRFELVVVAVLVALLAVAALGLAGLLDGTGYATCGLSAFETPTSCEAISHRFYDLQDPWGSGLRTVLVGLAFVAAVLLGVPLVARELE